MSEIVQEIKSLLNETLQIGDRADSFDESTSLLGNISELDSMAVVTLITAIEEQYGFVVEDDEISAETFESVGSLVSFVDQKLQA